MNILEEANKLVNGTRQADYDSPENNFQKIAKVYSTITGDSMTASNAALFMVCVKLCREGYKHKRDNCTDGSAYFFIRSILEGDDL